MPAGRFLQARGTEGGPADLARSTAEGVGGHDIRKMAIRGPTSQHGVQTSNHWMKPGWR